MEVGLIIKIMIFIILALFASWPYFEKIVAYSWVKRIWIGCSIVSLLSFGVMDILGSDKQAKNDKLEISKLDNEIADIKENQKSEFKDIKKMQTDKDKKDSDRLNQIVDRITIQLQENKGNILRAIKDTSNR